MWALLVLLATCVSPPVDAAIIDPYRPPTCPWCPGNRGIEFASVAGDEVRAVLSGHVSFVGRVVSTNYVSIADASGRRLTYGGLGEMFVAMGERVLAGRVIGLAAGPLHFGVRRGDGYEDPSVVLHGRPRARLVRVDGRRRPPSGSIACGQTPVGSLNNTMTRTPPAVAVRRSPR